MNAVDECKIIQGKISILKLTNYFFFQIQYSLFANVKVFRAFTTKKVDHY